MKRILLFVLTNLAVVLVLGVVASLLGVNRYLTANGLNLGALLGFALVMGFGGAIISLLISKPMAKWTSGVRVIDGSGSPDERWIVDTVRKFAEVLERARGKGIGVAFEDADFRHADLGFGGELAHGLDDPALVGCSSASPWPSGPRACA